MQIKRHKIFLCNVYEMSTCRKPCNSSTLWMVKRYVNLPLISIDFSSRLWAFQSNFNCLDIVLQCDKNAKIDDTKICDQFRESVRTGKAGSDSRSVTCLNVNWSNRVKIIWISITSTPFRCFSSRQNPGCVNTYVHSRYKNSFKPCYSHFENPLSRKYAYNTSGLFNINTLVFRILGESNKLVEILFVKNFCLKNVSNFSFKI